MQAPQPADTEEADSSDNTAEETVESGIIHNLKIRSEFFQAVVQGTKTFELRKNDRDFQAGDRINLMEFEEGRFTGNTVKKTITYILEGFDGLKDGYCILAIK